MSRRRHLLVGAVIAIALLPDAGARAQDGSAGGSYTGAVLQFEIPPDAPSAVLHFFCWPPTGGQPGIPANGTLTVGSDGQITGSCTVDHEQEANDGSSFLYERSSTVTGTYDASSQRAQLHLEGTGTLTYFPPPDCSRCEGGVTNHTIVLDSPSINVVNDHAKGEADYTFTCQPAIGCNAQFPSQASAIFDLAFTPPLAAAGSAEPAASPAAPPRRSSSGSSNNPFLIALALAGVSGAVIAAWKLYFANQGRRATARTQRLAAEGITPPVLHGAVGSDRSGGYEDQLEYGEGAGTASPASSKAYEALVVAQGTQSSKEEPLIKSSQEKQALEDERDRLGESPSDAEGR